jgi:hypothetical protein
MPKLNFTIAPRPTVQPPAPLSPWYLRIAVAALLIGSCSIFAGPLIPLKKPDACASGFPFFSLRAGQCTLTGVSSFCTAAP